MGTQPVDEYCRDIETYLCRKNDGHLIRVVGPSFEIVSRLGGAGRAAEDRVRRHRPLLRALLPQGSAPPAGEDRLLRRRRARCLRRMAPRHRCSVDVGLVSTSNQQSAIGNKATSLPAHLERVVMRLTSRTRQRIARRRVRRADRPRGRGTGPGPRPSWWLARSGAAGAPRPAGGARCRARANRRARGSIRRRRALLAREAESELAGFRSAMPPTPSPARRRRSSIGWCASGTGCRRSRSCSRC